MKTENIKKFLNSLSNKIDDDNIELYEKIIDSSKIEYFNNPEEFYFTILYPWEQFISGYLKTELNANEDIEFIYKNSKYIQRHFTNLFREHEGYVCCADKSKTIIEGLLNFYTNGKKIKFDYNNEYTFHLPKKIFKNHDEIIDFYKALKSFFYGNPQKFNKLSKKYYYES